MKIHLLNHFAATALTAAVLSVPSAVSAHNATVPSADGNTAPEAVTADSLLARQLRAEGVTFSHNNSVALLMNGQEKFDDLFKAIDQARSTIHMEYFNFRNDSINRELISHLVPKVREGVKVRLIFDGFGNASNNSPMRKRDLRYIRSKGIEIREFNPCDSLPRRCFQPRPPQDCGHRRRIAYTGGMNIADYYIKGTERVGSWHDMHCRISGEEVNTLQRIFVRMWELTTGRGIDETGLYHGGQDISYFNGLKPDTCGSAGQRWWASSTASPTRQTK